MPDSFFRGFFPKTVSDATSLEGIGKPASTEVTPSQEMDAPSILALEQALKEARTLEGLITLLEAHPQLRLTNGQPVNTQEIRNLVTLAISQNTSLALEAMTTCDVRGIPGVWEALKKIVEQPLETSAPASTKTPEVTPILGEKRILRPEKNSLLGALLGNRKAPTQALPEAVHEKELQEKQAKSGVLRNTLTKMKHGARLIGSTVKKGIDIINTKLDEAAERGDQQYQKYTRGPRYEHLHKAYSPQQELINTAATPHEETSAPEVSSNDERYSIEGPQSLPHALMDELIVKKNDAPANTNEQERTVRTPEEHVKKLDVIDLNSKKIREKAMETLEASGKKFLNFLDKGSRFLNENVRKGPKLFACLGLCAAGALSAPAAPVTITAIALASIVFRGLSAAGTYVMLREILDKKYAKWEAEGITKGTLNKAFLETGAVLTAALSGQIIGTIFDTLVAPALPDDIGTLLKKILPENYEPISGTLPSPPPVQTENVSQTFAKNIFDGNPGSVLEHTPQLETSHTIPVGEQTQTIAEASTETNITPHAEGNIVHETLASTIPSVEGVHKVESGETLWGALRKTLSHVEGDTFKDLASRIQDAKIQTIIDTIKENPAKFGIVSGNVGVVYPGDVIDIRSLLKP